MERMERKIQGGEVARGKDKIKGQVGQKGKRKGLLSFFNSWFSPKGAFGLIPIVFIKEKME